MPTQDATPRWIRATSLVYYQLAYDAVCRSFNGSGPSGAIEAVIMSVTCAEAAVNEMSSWYENHPAGGRPFPNDFQELPLETKWFLLPVIAGVEPFEKSGQPWQDFGALVNLRNALVHAKAGVGPPKRAMATLKTRGCLSDAPSWLVAAMTPGTAKWALTTVREVFEDASRRVRGRYAHRSLEFFWFWEIHDLPDPDDHKVRSEKQPPEGS